MNTEKTMAKNILIAALGLVVVLGSWFAYVYFSDKEVIKRQLFGLAAEIGKDGQEPPVKMALKMGHIKNMADRRCMVIIPERGYEEALESDLIIQSIIYYRNRFALLAVSLDKMIILVSAKDNAEVQVTVTAQHQYSAQADPVKKVHKVGLTLIKSDKKWLIRKILIPAGLLG